MRTISTIETIEDRLKGQQVERLKAMSLAGTAGLGVASLAYKILRSPDSKKKKRKK